jgi:hypothetical protein
VGWLQRGPFPRDEHGELDEPLLLVFVQKAVLGD